MKDSSNIIIGVLVGVAAGIALGILLKPKQIVKAKKVNRPSFNELGKHIGNRVSEALSNRFKIYTDDFDDHVEHVAF